MHGANDVNAQPLFVGMVRETGKPGNEQAQTAPSGNVSASDEDLQSEPSEVGARQRNDSQRGEERRAADDGEKPSGGSHDQMLLTLLSKQTQAIDSILENQCTFRAQLDRAEGQIEQMQLRFQMRQNEGRGNENCPQASPLAGYGGYSQINQDARTGYHPDNQGRSPRQDHQYDD